MYWCSVPRRTAVQCMAQVMKQWLQLRWACHVSNAHSSDQQLSIAHQTKSTLWLPHLYMGCCWMVTELHVGLNQKHGADDGNRRTVLLSLLWAMCHDQGLFPALSSFLFSCFVIKVMFFKTTATQHKYVMHRQWSSFCWLLYFWDAFWRRRSKCVYVDTYTHRYVGVHMLGGRDIELLHPEHRPFQTCPGILFRFLWWYPHSAQVHQDHPLPSTQLSSTVPYTEGK